MRTWFASQGACMVYFVVLSKPAKSTSADAGSWFVRHLGAVLLSSAGDLPISRLSCT